MPLKEFGELLLGKLSLRLFVIAPLSWYLCFRETVIEKFLGGRASSEDLHHSLPIALVLISLAQWSAWCKKEEIVHSKIRSTVAWIDRSQANTRKPSVTVLLILAGRCALMGKKPMSGHFGFKFEIM